MLRTTFLLSAVLLPLAVAVPLALEQDRATVVPDKSMIAQTNRELAAYKVALGDAVAAVAKETGAAVSRAEHKLVDGKPVYEVTAVGGGRDWRCVVDGTTGAVTKNETPAASKVALADALASVAKETGAAASRAEFRLADGKPVYDVSAYADGKAWQCVVDGLTGAVTKNELPAYTFPGDAIAGDWVTTPSGLRYTEIRVGTGPKPRGPASRVKVHYTGWFLDGGKFDSSVDKNEPAMFPLNQVIAGWTEGVGSMQVGGKRKLVIPYALAYGERGRPGAIPPKSTLVFDVELLQIVSD